MADSLARNVNTRAGLRMVGADAGLNTLNPISSANPQILTSFSGVPANTVAASNVTRVAPATSGAVNFSATDFANLSIGDVQAAHTKAGDSATSEAAYDEQLVRYFNKKTANVDDFLPEEEKGGLPLLPPEDKLQLDDLGGPGRGRHTKLRYRREGEEEKSEKKEEKDGKRKNEERAEAKRKPGTKDLRDAGAPEIAEARGARKLASGAEDLAKGAEGAGRVAKSAKEIVTVAKTAWQASRLLRVAAIGAGAVALGVGAVVGAVAVGTVVATVAVAGVAFVGTAAIVGYATNNKDLAFKSAMGMAGESVIPTSARDEWKKGNRWNAIDQTLGVSDAWSMAKSAGKMVWNGAKAVVQDPQGSIDTIKHAGRIALKTTEIAGAVITDGGIMDGGVRTLSDVITGENTGGLTKLAGAVQKNQVVMQQVTDMTGNIFGPQPPSPALAGGKNKNLVAENDNTAPRRPVGNVTGLFPATTGPKIS